MKELQPNPKSTMKEYAQLQCAWNPMRHLIPEMTGNIPGLQEPYHTTSESKDEGRVSGVYHEIFLKKGKQNAL